MKTRSLISCLTHCSHIQPIYWGGVFFIFFFPWRPSSLHVTWAPAAAVSMQNCPFQTVSSQNRPQICWQNTQKSRAEPWFLTRTYNALLTCKNKTCLHTYKHTSLSVNRASPCCRDLFTCGYWDSRGSACWLLPPTVKSPNKSTVSWEKQTKNKTKLWVNYQRLRRLRTQYKQEKISAELQVPVSYVMSGNKFFQASGYEW